MFANIMDFFYNTVSFIDGFFQNAVLQQNDSAGWLNLGVGPTHFWVILPPPCNSDI